MSERLKPSLVRWLICVLLALAAFIVYLPSLGFSYINLDDPDYVINNLHVRQGLNWESVRWAFTAVDNSNWHPLTSLSNVLICHFFGLEPAWQHGLNILFHALNTVLVFLLVLKLTGRRWTGIWVALLFAWHPMHVESVAWVSERKDVLSGFFFFLTLLAYVRYVELRSQKSETRSQNPKSPRLGAIFRLPSSTGCYVLSLVFFALGLMSKPMLVTVPVILLLLDFWPLQRIQNWKWEIASWKLVLLEKIPFFVLTAISCWVTIHAQSQALISTADFSLAARLAHVPVAYLWYVRQLFWPDQHSVYYILHGADSAEAVVGALSALVVLSGAVLWLARRYPYLLMGWLFFLVTLVPVVGFVQAGSQAYADRYTYLPYLGLFLMLACGVPAACRRCRLPAAVPAILGGLAVLACLLLVRRQVAVWADSESLFKQAVEQDPENQQAWILYGLHFNHAGDPDRALECLRKTLSLNAGNIEAWNNLGRILCVKGQYDEAESAFQTALQGGRHLTPAIHKNLADLYLQTGKLQPAIDHLEQSLAAQPNQPVVILSLAATCAGAGQNDKAIAAYQRLIQLIGDNVDARMGLASVYSQLGQEAEAARQYRQALALQPATVAALNNLAWLLATSANPAMRDGKEAVRLAEKACRLTEFKQAFLIGTLAAAQAETGDYASAVTSAEQARTLALKNGQKDLADRNGQLLELYRAGQPYRESPRPPG